ncbi:MAG: glycine cleavage system protein GcvH [Candidatus Omnitrophica bacterium]|nr:glycine cleavage system protein GcvH [Candidatus Omnitrophota bacterium]
MIKYSKSHEWAKIDGDTAEIGITDYAQSQLGDIVFVETSVLGDTVNQGDTLGTIESTKAASEIFSPLSGEVIAVNDQVETSPQLINESAMDKGWLVKIKISNPNDLDNLMDQDQYKKFVESEAH